MNVDTQYRDLVQRVLQTGTSSDDRTGVGTIRVFSHDMTLDVSDNLAVVTMKRTYWKTALKELYAFINAFSKASQFEEIGINYWSKYDREDLGPIYGNQWRNFGGVDQLQEVVDTLCKNPESRRIIISAWNPPEHEKMVIPVCTMTWHFFADVHTNELSVRVYQRSCDMMIGVPFDFIHAAGLLHFVAALTGFKPKYIHYGFGDCHIYSNHMEQALNMVKEPILPQPKVQYNFEEGELTSIDQFDWKLFDLVDYQHGPELKLKMAV